MTPLAFGELLEKAVFSIQAGRDAVLLAEAERLKVEAQAMFGLYPENGEWDELKDATQRARERQGYEPNDPLLVTGELKESVECKVKGRSGFVGSNDPIMFYQEIGTETIPPRPVFGLLVQKETKHIVLNLGNAIFKLITG